MVGPCIDRERRIEKTKFQCNMIFESQYILKRCKDKITVCWGVEGGILAHVQCLKVTRSHFSVNAKKGCEKSSVAMQIDARIQSQSNFHLMFC